MFEDTKMPMTFACRREIPKKVWNWQAVFANQIHSLSESRHGAHLHHYTLHTYVLAARIAPAGDNFRLFTRPCVLNSTSANEHERLRCSFYITTKPCVAYCTAGRCERNGIVSSALTPTSHNMPPWRRRRAAATMRNHPNIAVNVCVSDNDDDFGDISATWCFRVYAFYFQMHNLERTQADRNFTLLLFIARERVATASDRQYYGTVWKSCLIELCFACGRLHKSQMSVSWFFN